MKTIFTAGLLALLLAACQGTTSSSDSSAPTEAAEAVVVAATDEGGGDNTLTEQEKRDGWELLFNGQSTEHWRGAHQSSFPARGWMVKDGMLIVQPSDGAESQNGGDIVTNKEYGDVDFQVDFKLTEGANSGIKYFVTEGYNSQKSAIGLEYQLLDDARHPDAKLGNNGGDTRTLASLYDLKAAPSDKPARPVGEWNTARIVVQGNHVVHYLNGEKVLEYDRGSDAYKKLVQASKYKKWKNFGMADQGHILLQDHGNQVFFKNIKVRDLSAS